MYISPKSGWHTSLEMFWSRGAMNMDWEFDCWKEKQDEFYRDFRCEWYLSWEVNKNGSRLADILIESWLMDHPDYRMAAKNAA